MLESLRNEWRTGTSASTGTGVSLVNCPKYLPNNRPSNTPQDFCSILSYDGSL